MDQPGWIQPCLGGTVLEDWHGGPVPLGVKLSKIKSD
jgi:hypothetical protein